MKTLIYILAAAMLLTSVAAANELAQVRRATSKYHDVENALEDGYMNTHECVSSPDGAMGIHFLNRDLLNDGIVDLSEPEILMYEPMNNGRYRLVGVEYMLPTEPQGLAEIPEVAGEEMEFMHPHEPLDFYHYELHAWVWQANPLGMFAPFNPNIQC